MHIAIEGLDSAGKTAVALMLAQSLHGVFIEKPLQYLLGGRKKYMQLAEKLNTQAPVDLRAWFYGFGDLYFSKYLADGTVVTDRYFLSNWVRNGTEENQKIFDVLASQIRPPEHTFLLATDMAVMRRRMLAKDRTEKARRELDMMESLQEKYTDGLQRYGFSHTVLNCGELPAREVHRNMLRVLKHNGLLGRPEGPDAE